MKIRFSLLILCLALVAAISASAAPIVTDGSYTAYIGEESHLFLQDANGGVKTLRSTAVTDIVGMQGPYLYCLTEQNQLYCIVMDGSGPTTIAVSDPDAGQLASYASAPAFELQNNYLTLPGAGGLNTAVAENVIIAAASRSRLYYIQSGTPNQVFMVPLPS